ncbi:MAG: ABC transporter substrate-binding protein [Bernardetiaceae bacterium]
MIRNFNFFFSPLIGLILLSLTGCNSNSSPEGDANGSTGNALRPANGDRYYGGTFRLNETEFIRSLFPHNIVDVYSYRVASQIYEGLYKLNQETLQPEMNLAQETDLDSTRTVYTIRLKKGVFFQDDACFPDGKGRQLKAQDVVFSFTRLCTQSGLDNQGFHVVDGIIKGARAHYEASTGGQVPGFALEGVKALDDYTVAITLEKPNSLFKYILARPELYIFPEEAHQKYGLKMAEHPVGTGPFALYAFEQDISIILKRHPNYHGTDRFGNQLPFLDAIDIKFIGEKKTELYEFQKGNLEMIYRLPTDHIIEILDMTDSEKFQFQREPEMQTQIMVLMNQGKVFENKDLRKAFSFALDRTKILDDVLNGEGDSPGFYGLTPPLFKNLNKEVPYPIDQIPGYRRNVDSARYYLAKAGYPNGEGFPEVILDLNADGNRHTIVALEVQKQLSEVLNISIKPRLQPHSQITNKSMLGQFDMIRLSWGADFPHPESFLKFFYSKELPDSAGQSSFPNLSRYASPEFDRLYEAALSAATDEEAYQYFLQAEQVAMRDAPILVLWYDEAFRLLQPYVKNFPNNAMQYRDFSAVYLTPRLKSADNNKVALR